MFSMLNGSLSIEFEDDALLLKPKYINIILIQTVYTIIRRFLFELVGTILLDKND